MSGSAKDDEKPERPKLDRTQTAPLRASSQNLFELDSPPTSGAHALGLPQLSPADVQPAPPANDVHPPTAAKLGAPGSPAALTGDPILDAQLIDQEFAALVNTSELEAPILAAHEAAAQAAAERRYETRPLTHVATEQDFESTLKLPKPSDAVESRRGRLAVRYKAACASYKVMTGFEIGGSDRKELVELFSGYEAKLRAALPPAAIGEANKRDADALHSLIPPPGMDDLERHLTKIEERLLAVDETMPEEEFRTRVSKAKHPIKSILRYARVLASKRFNVGYRRDRFEYLATELLTTQGADKRLQLLTRDKAGTVLHHLLAGLPQPSAPEERAPAAAHLREALDRLASISGHKEFFDSEFFLDLHGYKISMRDQITCPEFLYLSTAVHVELHNRMLAWCRNGTPSWQALRAQLARQQTAAEDVFTNFKRPRSTPVAKSSPKPLPGAEATAQPAPVPKRKRKRKAVKEVDKASTTHGWLKLAALALVVVLTTTSALHSAGVFSLSTPPTILSEAQLQNLSPLLTRGTIVPKTRQFEGAVTRTAWQSLRKADRRAMAADLAAKLKRMDVENARVVAYKTPVIRIEFSTVVLVDEVSGNPAP